MDVAHPAFATSFLAFVGIIAQRWLFHELQYRVIRRNKGVDAFNTATINAVVERFCINIGEWPKTNLNDNPIETETDINYFPDGIPLNPVDGKKYKLDSQTDRGKM